MYILHPRQGMIWPRTLLCLQPPGQVDDRAPFGHNPSQVRLECHSPRLSSGATGCICVGGPCMPTTICGSQQKCCRYGSGFSPVAGACTRTMRSLCEQVTLSETRTWPLFFYPSVPIESSNVLLFSADQNQAGRMLFLQRYGDLSPSAMVQVSLCAAAPGFLNDATLQPVLKKQCKGFPLPRVESSDGPVQLPFPIGGPSMAGIDATDQIDITPENFAHYGPLFCDDGNLDCTLRCRPCPLC